MTVMSSPYLPFIDIDEQNRSTINSNTGMSKFFYALHRSGSEETEINYVYDENLRQAFISIKDCEQNHYNKLQILSDVEPYVEGPSLFFYARRNSHTKSSVYLPTMIGGQLQTTLLNFDGPVEFIDVPAFSEAVRTRCYEGSANWQGGTSAGLSGKFSGWISDDQAAVTLKAEMAILLGSVVIELESYEREGWIPPTEQYQDVLTRKE
jgi:hypothetical protein